VTELPARLDELAEGEPCLIVLGRAVAALAEAPAGGLAALAANGSSR
jgi:hypothetical protein